MERRDFLRKSALAALGTAVAGSGLVQALNLIDNNQSKNDNTMKIVVLTGSPRKNGNSAYLAEQFIKGAEEQGHEVFRFDCAFRHVEPCRACNRCGMDGPCIIDDDFLQLRPKLVEADMVVFATPMYYFGISAQMKRVIDRFYAINCQIKGAPKKAAFLMTYADTARKEPSRCSPTTARCWTTWAGPAWARWWHRACGQRAACAAPTTPGRLTAWERACKQRAEKQRTTTSRTQSDSPP